MKSLETSNHTLQGGSGDNLVGAHVFTPLSNCPQREVGLCLLPVAPSTSHGHVNPMAAHSSPKAIQGAAYFIHGIPCGCSVPKVTHSPWQLRWKPISP